MYIIFGRTFSNLSISFCLFIVSVFIEKLADEPVKKPAIVNNINKWEGEDEDDVKVSFIAVVTCMCSTFTFF